MQWLHSEYKLCGIIWSMLMIPMIQRWTACRVSQTNYKSVLKAEAQRQETMAFKEKVEQNAGTGGWMRNSGGHVRLI